MNKNFNLYESKKCKMAIHFKCLQLAQKESEYL